MLVIQMLAKGFVAILIINFYYMSEGEPNNYDIEFLKIILLENMTQ